MKIQQYVKKAKNHHQIKERKKTMRKIKQQKFKTIKQIKDKGFKKLHVILPEKKVKNRIK